MQKQYKSPFSESKAYLDIAFADLEAPRHEILESCCEILSSSVRNQDYKFGAILSTEVKDLILVEGLGLRMLGFKNPREYKLFNLFESIPPAYAWIFHFYLMQVLNRIKSGNCGKCLFTISLPLYDRAKKKLFRAYVRISVIDFQKPDNQPRLLLLTIDLPVEWSFEMAPILAIGSFTNTMFPDSVETFNQEMKSKVSKLILYEYLGLTAMQIRFLDYLIKGRSRKEIMEDLNFSVSTYNYNSNEINKKCKNQFGNTNDIRQWANYFKQMFFD